MSLSGRKIETILDQTIKIGEQDWFIRIFGAGPELLIALHGFGEDGRIYNRWEKSLGAVYTIVAVDLPHHGDSINWAAGDFRPDQLLDLIDKLLEQHSTSTYDLIGHSLGARLIISCWKQLPQKPHTIWLLSPDGLATRRVAVVNRLPVRFRKWINRSIVHGYKNWIRLAALLHRFNLVDAFTVRYIRHHLSDQKKRRRLMGTWIMLSRLPIDRKELLEDAQQQATEIHLVIGEKDALIDWGNLGKWLKKWPASKLHILDAGHNLVNEKVAALIRWNS